MKFQLHLFWLIVIIDVVIIISIVTIIIIIALLLLLSFLLFFAVLSILFYLLLIFLLFLSACRVVTYDVYVSPRPYFIIILAFLVSDLHYIMALLMQASVLIIVVYIIIVIIIFTYFLSILLVSYWGKIQWMNSSGMVYPYQLVILDKQLYLPSVFFFFVSYSLMTTFEVLTSSLTFIIWHRLLMMPRKEVM